MNGFERRKEQKKEAIRQAALELFKLYGSEKVSISDIARKAKVSHVTIYNHFGSKEELIREVTKSLLLGLLEKYRAIIEGDKSFPEKLEIIFLDKTEIASQFQGELLQTAASSDPLVLEFIESLWQKEFNQLTLKFIEEGKKSGYINGQLSQEAILAYLEILRKGMRAIPDLLTSRANKPEFARDLVSLIHFGLMGKIDKQQ
jgi:TetR/AcrR family transcriptional regulator, cholesterol catabolism regulator